MWDAKCLRWIGSHEVYILILVVCRYIVVDNSSVNGVGEPEGIIAPDFNGRIGGQSQP